MAKAREAFSLQMNRKLKIEIARDNSISNSQDESSVSLSHSSLSKASSSIRQNRFVIDKRKPVQKQHDWHKRVPARCTSSKVLKKIKPYHFEFRGSMAGNSEDRKSEVGLISQ